MDPFNHTPEFKEEVIDEILNNPKKTKIGIFDESKFLPVSNSVKRAM